MKRCMQCMKEYGDSNEICIHCGYKPGSSEREHYYLPEGTTLGDRYIVGKVLGHGGFGITYIGFDQKLMIRIAIKEYLPAEISTRALGETTVTTFSGDKHDAFVYGLGRFIDEAKTMAQFETNPCIVSVKDFFEANDTAYLVMEYLDGITLGEYLKRSGGRISEEEARSVMRPVIDALREVHAKGIIHRDISPDNIFILSNSQVKLLDFGAARHAMSEKSKSLSVVLKPGFAPPEQYYTRGKQGPWTDVYALGATMFRMLKGENPPEAMERMVDDTLDDLLQTEYISPAMKPVLKKALEIKAEQRYQTIQAMYSAVYAGGGAAAFVKETPPKAAPAPENLPWQGGAGQDPPIAAENPIWEEQSDIGDSLFVRVGLGENSPFKTLLILSCILFFAGIVISAVARLNYIRGFWLFMLLSVVLATDVVVNYHRHIKELRIGIAGGILFAAGVLSCFLIPIGNVVETSFVIAYVVLFAAVLLKFIKPKSRAASIAQTVLMVLTALLGMIEVIVYYFEDRTYGDVTSASLVGLALMICIFLWMSWNVVIRQYAVDEPIEKKQWVMAGLYVVAMILMASGVVMETLSYLF